MRKLGHILETVISQVSRAAGAIATVALMCIMLLTVADVLMRFLFNKPILGSVELCQYLIIIGGFLGLAWCAVRGGHVKVGMIIDRLSPRSQSIADIISYLIALSIVPLVAWRNFIQARIVQLEQTSSTNLEIPAFPFYIVVGTGFALLALAILVLLAKSISSLAKSGKAGKA